MNSIMLFYRMERSYGRFSECTTNMVQENISCFPNTPYARAYDILGPIVRITPHELHVMDSSFYDEIYAGGNRKRNKYTPFVRFYGVPESMLGTADHNLHHLRRKLLNNYFSKRSISNIQPLIRGSIDELVEQLKAARQTGEIINLDEAFSNFTTDVISQYFYGCRFNKEFKSNLRRSLLALTKVGHLLRFIPFNLSKLKRTKLVQNLSSNGSKALQLHAIVGAKSLEALEKKGEAPHTIFDNLTDHNVPLEERSQDRLEDEGIAILSAGSETTTRVLSVTMYYLLKDREILFRLHDEIKTIMPQPSVIPTWSELEGLPLLV